MSSLAGWLGPAIRPVVPELAGVRPVELNSISQLWDRASATSGSLPLIHELPLL